MNSGKSFSMFIRAKKREENNEEIVEKLFQNKGFFCSVCEEIPGRVSRGNLEDTISINTKCQSQVLAQQDSWREQEKYILTKHCIMRSYDMLNRMIRNSFHYYLAFSFSKVTRWKILCL